MRFLQKATLWLLAALSAVPRASGFAGASLRLTGRAAQVIRSVPRLTDRAEVQSGAGGVAAHPQGNPARTLLVTVVDENNVPVSSARLTLLSPQGEAPLHGETDYAGRFKFADLSPGTYHLRVEKEGFYALNAGAVRLGEIESVDVTLNHQQEFVEVTTVTASPPTIDPAKTAAAAQLSSLEIMHLPYTVNRDIRYALPFLPGVVRDSNAQLHLEGSSARQIFDRLDGFNVTSPISGLFNMRVSVDALRSVQVESSRMSAEFGKASGGVLDLSTGMGDDRFRFSGTDFLPSIQNRKGLRVNSWTPRGMFSGPLRKGRAWFLDALDGEYDLNIVKELPAGADQNPSWRLSNLAKAQVNLSQSNQLTTSFVVNGYRSEHAGLSPFNPVESTETLESSAYLFTVKDQAYFSNGALLEVGMGFSHFHGKESPLGVLPYVLRPESTSGNFFRRSDGHSTRLQWIANLIPPPRQWHGRHEFKLGIDVDRITTHRAFERGPILIYREDGTLSREVTFLGLPPLGRDNVEAAGYAQDRWSLSDRLLFEAGLRFDRDEIVHRTLVSPRLATTVLLTRKSETKLSAGIGLADDATSLALILEPLAGQRFDLFFGPDGATLLRPPLETFFRVNEHELKGARSLNWSAGVERKLPASLYLSLDFLERRGLSGWAYTSPGSHTLADFTGIFELGNIRRDRYDALHVNVRRIFKGDHAFFASYTRSASRSNAVLDLDLDNPIFSQQAPGPYPWDVPNRFIAWGWVPLRRGFDLAYSLDWRDGFPFSLVNQNQQLAGPPGSRRFPAFFALNMYLERRFHLLGYQWAFRGGFDNITNHSNPSFVNNNVDSPFFLTFAGGQVRVLTGRIRLLGRK